VQNFWRAKNCECHGQEISFINMDGNFSDIFLYQYILLEVKLMLNLHLNCKYSAPTYDSNLKKNRRSSINQQYQAAKWCQLGLTQMTKFHFGVDF
jgi:hypothetical protein